MKVLLINPNSGETVFGKISSEMQAKTPPLGLAYIAAVLRKNKIDVMLVDGDTKLIQNSRLLNIISEFKPDFIGLTCATASFSAAIETANLCRQVSSSLIVIGGPHVSATAEETLFRYPIFDIVVKGEGEFSMLEICQGHNLTEIKGISYRHNNKIIHNPPRERIKDLDVLPRAAYDLLDLNLYKDPIYNIYAKKVISIITSRGCPYQCTFCASKVIFGSQVIFRSLESVVDDILYLISEHNVDGIFFADDTFTLNKDRITKFCNCLYKLKIKWICNARVDTLDFEILKLMRDSGCKLIQIGVESGDQGVLDLMKKKISLEKVETVFRWCSHLKLDTFPTFIIGMPGDNRYTINKTIAFAKRLNSTFPLFFLPVPYPGTQLYEYGLKNQLLLFNDWTQVKAPKYENPAMRHQIFSAKELKSYQKRAYREIYFSPRYIIKNVLPNLFLSNKRKHFLLLAKKFLKGFRVWR